MDPGAHPTLAMIPLLDGFAIGLSLILAIGPQGMFVLRHGLSRQHLHLVCLLCCLSDVALITASIAGGLLLAELPGLPQAIALAGAAFLLCYGVDRIRVGTMPAEPPRGIAAARSWRMAALGCLAVTWLNPGVYSDMLVIGGLAGRHAAPDRVAFGLGAWTASATFFCALGYGARLLAPLFGRPAAWRALELASGLAMLAFAVTLVASVLS